MRILFAASEVAPIIKIGGLGDVIGSLPKALSKIDVEVDIVVPYFPSAKVDKLKVVRSFEFQVPYNTNSYTVEVYKTKLPESDVDVFLLGNTDFFSKGGTNAFSNNLSETEMFSFFNRSVVELIKTQFNTYDVIHCHDWHTGLITHLLQDELELQRPATLITIHNLSYQGVGDGSVVSKLGIVPGSHQLIDWDLSDDSNINLLLQGITSSDYISTVSPSYAKEILYKDIGGPLAEILQDRSARIEGILNGIDYNQFPRYYDIVDWKEGKKKYKEIIQEKLNLNKNPDAPIFSFISRLDPNQKGLDILAESVSKIVEFGGQFVLLGTGDPKWEEILRNMQNDDRLKGNISMNITFDVTLANEIYAGSNFLLIPSRFEPCGLTQMIAMKYGTLPVVHETGGLRDSVKDSINGISFKIYSSDDLTNAIKRSIETFNNKKKYEEMVLYAFHTDFSWDKSAKKYLAMYKKVIRIREETVKFSESLNDE